MSTEQEKAYTALRANHKYLTNPQDGTTGKIFTYTCDHDLAECLKDGYFDNLISNLLPADTIRLIQKDSVTAEVRKAKVLACQDVMVVALEAPHVYVAPSSNPWRFEQTAEAPASVQPGKAERFVEQTGTVCWNKASQRFDITVDGLVIATTGKGEKELALRIAHGDAPIPEPVAA